MTLNDLPEIEIKRNIRSTRLRLRVDAHHIRLTAPLFCTKRQIQNFIQQSEQWLIQTWQKQQSQIDTAKHELPETLTVFDIGKAIQIVYTTQKNNYKFDDIENKLYISLRHPEKYLKAFVIDYAKDRIPHYLEKISQESGLTFTACTIRQPKTRWGSCSAKKEIMLNSALVLYPMDIVRYVCIHELAHTIHFNHSANFWQLVEQHDALYKTHQRILKTTPMPWWWSLAK